MTDQLDRFVGEMQTQIDTDALKTYGKAAFDRWKSPRCMYKMQNPDGHGRVSGDCGDTIQVFLKFNSRGRVSKASFITDGCGPSGICGSFAVETAMGKSPEDLTDITGDTILELAGGLPRDDRHCAFLSAAALQAALDDYMKKQINQKHNGPVKSENPGAEQ
jgi:nitrogen fixation NifU-like protein